MLLVVPYHVWQFVNSIFATPTFPTSEVCNAEDTALRSDYVPPWVLTTPTIRQGRFQGQRYIRNSMKGSLYGNLVSHTCHFILFALLSTHQCVQSASCQLPLPQWEVFVNALFRARLFCNRAGCVTPALRIYSRGTCFETEGGLV